MVSSNGLGPRLVETPRHFASMEIKIGEPHRTIHYDYSVLITEPDGTFAPPTEKGLYFRDTRLISAWRVTVGGQPWMLLNSANETYCLTRAVLTNPAVPTPCGCVPEHTLQLTISRAVANGLHEDLDIQNYGMADTRFTLEIEVESDFADFFEVKGRNVVQRPGMISSWSEDDQTLLQLYRHGEFLRGVSLRFRSNASKPSFANGKVTFPVVLSPRGRWHTCVLYELLDGDDRFPAPQACPNRDGAHVARYLADERRKVARVRSPVSDFNRVATQAVEDIVALRLNVPGTAGAPIPAAGVPWFLSVFGRDSIIASLQYQIIDPEFSRGALERLAELQADCVDDYRDAAPGKIPHELRHGELAFFHKIPHTPYYGTADATPLYLVLLHSAWKCTGNDEILQKHLSSAERCLEWIDRFGDLDGDGLQEYQTRSPAGYENQSWKDAGDAILYPDGSGVKGPKALCELQGYVFDAWLRCAEIYSALGNEECASILRRKAEALYRQFNEKFWNEELGFYALTLDGDKKPVMSIASNPGHCLWSGIVPRERASRVVDRLMQPDMWSGWGVRTLSSQHCAYNPFSYQNGAVWPHDNSIIALGMKRYGFARQAGEIGRALCDAASYFDSDRLPEVFAGTGPEIGFPLRYIGSNVPQAWATGAIFFILQALVGFQPDAPRNRLELDPALPDWLPELEIKRLQIGKRRIHLRLWREGDETCFEVQNGGDLEVRRRDSVVPADAFEKK
jgi:glycogen debranching enzyme